MVAMTNNEYLKDFVPNPLSFRMKALGFDEPCFGCYVEDNNDVMFSHRPKNSNDLNYVRTWRSSPNDDVCSAPTFSQAFRWFRENYGFHIRFLEPYNNLATPDNKWRSSIHNMNRLFHGYTNGRYIVGDSYEEAELACLEKLLEIVESKSE